MASQYVIDLGINDDLQTIIKKSNHNFKAIISQQSKQAQIEAGDAMEAVASVVGEVVEDLVGQIESEANTRRQADDDLEGAIETVQSNLSAVATSGDYNDLINKPVIPVDGAYTTFGNEDPSSIYGGTWSMVDTIPVGSDSLNVWRRTS